MKDHAVVCCRFAIECSLILDALVRELEVEFGPDTADLNMRFGLHSGPVTAGVLRGERSRFQLFGDTGKLLLCSFVKSLASHPSSEHGFST